MGTAGGWSGGSSGSGPATSRFVRTTRRAAIAIAALAVAAAGCSSGADGSAPPDTGAASTTDAPSTFVTPPVPSTVTFPTGTAPAGTVEFRPVVVAPTQADGPTLDQLGPVAVDGNGLLRVDAARDESIGTWTVLPIFTAEGIEAFNTAAGECAALAPTCPSGQIALVVDGRVVSAPTIEAPRFEADQIVISGDYDEVEADALARAMSAGAHGR